MKSKIIKIAIIIIIIVIAFYLGRQSGLATETSTTITTITEEEVSKRTIQNTLSASGQIYTATTEQLEVSTSKYFSTMCVEEDDTVLEGENILEYTDGTYLVAPYNCVVTGYSVPDTGSIGTSSNYVEIESLVDLTTTLSVSENEITEIEVGQEVTIVPTADETVEITGTITKIDSIGTYQSSGTTFSVTVSFTNENDLKIGMSVSCTVILEEQEDVLTVPIDAVLVDDDDEKYVVVVNEDDTTENVYIETGISDDEYVEVISGLEEGQTVQITTTTTESSSSSSSDDDSMSGAMGGSMDMTEERGGGQSMDMPSGDSGGFSGGEGSSGGMGRE